VASELARALGAGVRLFNRRRFLDAHEAWEDAWRGAPGDDRGFFEGLVQLAGGLHLRTKRGGTRGAVHLLSQALVLLDDHRPAKHGVDVEGLVADVGAYVDWIRTLNRPHRLLDRGRLPRIKMF
jgi:hypothetical protein